VARFVPFERPFGTREPRPARRGQPVPPQNDHVRAPGRLSPLLLHPNSGAFRALPLSLPGDGQVSNHSLTSLYEHGKKFEMFTESQPFDMIEFRPFEIFKDLASVSAWVLGKGFDLQTVLSVRGTR
jgi:hypothetical protein